MRRLELTYGRRPRLSDASKPTNGIPGYKPNQTPLTDTFPTAAMRNTIERLTEKVERHDAALTASLGNDMKSALFLGELLVRSATPIVLNALQGENPVQDISRIADYVGKDTVCSILQGFAQEDGPLLDLLSPGGNFQALAPTGHESQESVKTTAWTLQGRIEICLAATFGIISEPRKAVLGDLATQLTNLAIKNATPLVLEALCREYPVEEISKIAGSVDNPIVRPMLESFVNSDDALLTAILSVGKDCDPAIIRAAAVTCLKSGSSTTQVSRE